MNHNIDIMLLYRDICVSLSQQTNVQYPLLSSSSTTPKYVFKRELLSNVATPALNDAKSIVQQNMKTLMSIRG
jgi:hypothetical protein